MWNVKKGDDWAWNEKFKGSWKSWILLPLFWKEEDEERERHTEHRVQTTIDASIGTYVNEELISESLPFNDVYFTSDNEWHAMDVKFKKSAFLWRPHFNSGMRKLV